MGSIKNSKPAERKLTEEEFKYVLAINQAKQQIMQEYNNVQAAFLNYVAKTRMGYEDDQDLQFELDFTDQTRTLKVTKL